MSRRSGLSIMNNHMTVDTQIEKDQVTTEENLKKMEAHYGKAALESMNNKEFYNAYKNHFA